MKFSNAQIYCYTYNEEVGDIRWVFQTKARIFNDKNYEQPKMHVIFWTKLKKTKKEWYDFVMQEIGKNLSNIGKCFEKLGYGNYLQDYEEEPEGLGLFWKNKFSFFDFTYCKHHGEYTIAFEIEIDYVCLPTKEKEDLWLCDLK